MIITLTLNPAIDKTSYIDPLIPGGLNRVKSFETDAGGKGINVSKVVAMLGGHSVATGFVGEENADFFAGELQKINCENAFFEVAGSTRTNLKILDDVNGITEVNEPGICVTKEEEQSLIKRILSYANEEAIFVFAGSMHKNAQADFYKELTKMVKQKGAKVFFDADAEAFSLALQSKPNFIKPNKAELLHHCKRKDATRDELIEICKEFTENGVETVVLSLGKEGAAFIRKNEAYFSKGLSVQALSTVGAGDSMVAAFAYAAGRKMTFAQSSTLALATSAAAVTTKGTNPPPIELVEALKQQVVLEELWSC